MATGRRHIWVGREICGCVMAAYVDDPARKEDVAKEIGQMVMGGLLVSRELDMRMSALGNGQVAAVVAEFLRRVGFVATAQAQGAE